MVVFRTDPYIKSYDLQFASSNWKGLFEFVSPLWGSFCYKCNLMKSFSNGNMVIKKTKPPIGGFAVFNAGGRHQIPVPIEN